MKKILLLASSVFFFSLAVMAQENTDGIIKINTEKHDFGKLKQGVPADYYFVIKNISDKAVVVENAWGSCGCTTPEIPKEPIAPGATAKLKVQYNSAAMGHFEKDVYVKMAGIEAPKNLKITGDVLTAEAYEAYVKEQPKPNTPAAVPAKPAAKNGKS
jgi:hypothetical protein